MPVIAFVSLRRSVDVLARNVARPTVSRRGPVLDDVGA
jgi:hypothetical protein